jgi:hypothetical protein
MSTAQSITPAGPRFRSRLGAALITLGLMVAAAVTAVILANAGVHRTSGAAVVVQHPPLAGARLDHRGLHDRAYLSGLAEVGARLDHRGVRASSLTGGSATQSSCVYSRPDHACVAP